MIPAVFFCETLRDVLQDELTRAHPIDPNTGALTAREALRIEQHIARGLDNEAARQGGEVGRIRPRLQANNVLVDPNIKVDFYDTRTGELIRSDEQFWSILRGES